MSLSHAIRTASVASLLLGAACSSNDLTAPIADESSRATAAAPAPTPAPAIASPLISAGAFYSYTTNNNGEEFWDNLSSDGEQCNIGMFADNTFGPCDNNREAAVLSNEFKNSKFLADSTGKPVPFSMSAGRYKITFLGGYRGAMDEPFGYAYPSGTPTTFTQIPTVISSTMGSEVTTTIPSDFAFYITPSVKIYSEDNCGTDGEGASSCSNDEFMQQFALFKKGDAYLLGIEDRATSTIGSYVFPGGFGYYDDRDYNDFFIRLEPIPESETVDGRMTGGLSAAVGTAKVPVQVSMTIHCDNRLSNNLSVSWGKIRFQMTKNAIPDGICSRTEPNTAGKPATDINVFEGTATGMVGKTPATLEFSFTDNGERKGAAPDKMDLTLIYGGTTLSTGGVISATGGNIQAHYDQPHRSK